MRCGQVARAKRGGHNDGQLAWDLVPRALTVVVKNLIPRYLIIRTLFTFHSLSYATIKCHSGRFNFYSETCRRGIIFIYDKKRLPSGHPHEPLSPAPKTHPPPQICVPKTKVANFALFSFCTQNNSNMWRGEMPNLGSENKARHFRSFSFCTQNNNICWGGGGEGKA